MTVTVTLFFLAYLASLLAELFQKKLEGVLKKAIKIINLSSLLVTFILFVFWIFNKHLSNLAIEIIPFWIFILSSMLIFGLTVTSRLEKVFYGIVFFGNLLMTIMLIIPFIGIVFFYKIYSPFWTDNILYQDKKIIITEDISGFMSPKPSPTIYIKKGLLSVKFKTSLNPIYDVDSVACRTLNDNTIEIEVYEDKKDGLDKPNMQRAIIECY